MQAKPADEMRSMIKALVISVSLFIVQLIAYFSTNMLIILAGAFDTLSDILISGFLLGSIYWSRKPADELHMFGHGRIQNVAALVTATIFIFFLSLETFRAAWPQLIHPRSNEIQNINLALIVTAAAIIFYAIPLLGIARTKAAGAALKAQLYALIEMEVAFIASLVSIVLVARGQRIADPITSIFIGTIIAFTGIKLFVDNAHFLIGKAPPQDFLDKISLTVKSVPGVLDVHELMAEYVGPNTVHTGFHITVARGTPIEEADRIAEEVQKRVRDETSCQFCVIHVDPDQAAIP